MVVEDLGSRNGVLVNSITIKRPVRLNPGDRITLGDETFEVVERQHSDVSMRRPTLKDVPQLPQVRDVEEEETGEYGSTRAADALELLTKVVDKALAMGKHDDAERWLSGHLARALDHAQAGVRLSANTTEIAARYAVKLAEATGKAAWIDYAFRLFTAISEPLPLGVIDELYRIMHHVRGVHIPTLRRYVEQLQLGSNRMSPPQRFAAKRIEGLLALAMR